MKRTYKYVFPVFVIIIMFTRCFPDQWHGIRVINKSQLTICLYGEYILPDTSLAFGEPILKEIKPNETIHLFDRDIGDTELKRFETDKLTIFVLDKEIVESYSWEDIRRDYKILKRYEINKQDLINMGGSVIYP